MLDIYEVNMLCGVCGAKFKQYSINGHISYPHICNDCMNEILREHVLDSHELIIPIEKILEGEKMAKALRCDRCESYYMTNELKTNNHCIAKVKTVNTDGYHVKEYDLCDKCVAEFFNFMGGKAITKIEPIWR